MHDRRCGRRESSTRSGSQRSDNGRTSSATRSPWQSTSLLRTRPRCIRVAGLSLGTAMAGVRKANRRDVLVVTARRGRRGRRRVHVEPILRRAGAAVPRAPRGRGRGARAARQHRQRQRRHRRRRADARALDLRGAGAPARLPARAGAAVLDRRDHGNAAARAHRGRAAGRAGGGAPGRLGRRGRGDHDDRHACRRRRRPACSSAARRSRSPASARVPA